MSALLVNPNERRIHIGDVFGRIVEVTRINIESQNDDTITTIVMTNQRITICTGLCEVTRRVESCQTKTHRVALANGCIDNRRILYMIVNIQMIDAIQRDTCNQRVLVRCINIVIRHGEELLIVRFEIPNMR